MPDNPQDLSNLAAWVKEREVSRPRKNKHLVAFLAARDFIRSALETGYAMHTIWEYLCDQNVLTYSYETFRNQCGRHLKNTRHQQPMAKGNKGKTEAVTESPSAPEKSGRPNEPRTPPKSTILGFKYDPNQPPEELF